MLLQNNNLLPLFFAFLPAAVYAVIVYLSFPKNTINLKLSFLYFLMGTLSCATIGVFLWTFPEWQYPLAENYVVAYFLLSFFQVGLLEEGSKYLFYKLTDIYRERRAHPASMMFYGMSVSTGFAVIENMVYLQQYGVEVLELRAFSAIILHMLTGLMLGYFMSIGMYKKNPLKYQLIGLGAVAAYHGLYDFNIFVTMTPDGDPTYDGLNYWVILSIGLGLTYFMMKHLKLLRNS